MINKELSILALFISSFILSCHDLTQQNVNITIDKELLSLAKPDSSPIPKASTQKPLNNISPLPMNSISSPTPKASTQQPLDNILLLPIQPISSPISKDSVSINSPPPNALDSSLNQSTLDNIKKEANSSLPIKYPTNNSYKGKIIFTSWESGNPINLSTINADKTDLKNLISDHKFTDSGSYSTPSISKDGSKILFSWGVYIYTMDIDGSNVLKLVSGSNPNFSPDGLKIIYNELLWNGISIINSNGTKNLTIIKSQSGSRNRYRFPSFSPDGLKILYTKNVEEGSQICSSNLDGSNEISITKPDPNASGLFGLKAYFSPDNLKIAFQKIHSSSDSGLYVMDSTGNNISQIISLPMNSISNFSWSPDSTKLIFMKNDGLYITDLNGDSLVKLKEQKEKVNSIKDPFWSDK